MISFETAGFIFEEYSSKRNQLYIELFNAEILPKDDYVLPNIYLTHFIVSEICAINLLRGDRILLFAKEWLVTLY